MLCRRSDQEGLTKLVTQIEDEGGTATGYLFNAVEDGTLEDCVAGVEAEIGSIEVVVFNLGANRRSLAQGDDDPSF